MADSNVDVLTDAGDSPPARSAESNGGQRRRWLVAGAGLVAAVVVVVVVVAGSGSTTRRPAVFTVSGGVADYYSPDCQALAGSSVKLIDPQGVTVGNIATLVPDADHSKGYCGYHYRIAQLPRRTNYRVVIGDIHGATGHYDFSYLVGQNWHLTSFVSPHGDQRAIEDLFARVDTAESNSEVDGLTEMSSDAWPPGAWTPQQIVCSATGQTLPQALDAMNAPGTLIHDQLDINDLQATPGWAPTSGPGAGQVPPGRLYVVGDGVVPTSGIPEGSLVHVDVMPDGTAVLFPLACGSTLHHNQ